MIQVRGLLLNSIWNHSRLCISYFQDLSMSTRQERKKKKWSQTFPTLSKFYIITLTKSLFTSRLRKPLTGSCRSTWQSSWGFWTNRNITPLRHDHYLWGFRTSDHAGSHGALGRAHWRSQQEELVPGTSGRVQAQVCRSFILQSPQSIGHYGVRRQEGHSIRVKAADRSVETWSGWVAWKRVYDVVRPETPNNPRIYHWWCVPVNLGNVSCI